MTRLDSALLYILASTTALAACDARTPTSPTFRELSEVPPNNPIPQALEVCILQAELCAAHAWQPGCDLLDGPDLEDCIESFEDCTWALPEKEHHAGENTCRVAHAWCTLEMPFSIVIDANPKAVALCNEIDAACPSYP